MSTRDPVGIFNWRRIDDRITTSGQPNEDQLAEIAALGIGCVINLGLHTHERALPDEAATVRQLGMAYVHIPVDFSNPAQEDFDRFSAALDQSAPHPVHVHCILNARVSAFFYRYRTERLGLDISGARAAMETIWRPGEVWASFVGDPSRIGSPHEYAGRDY